MVRAWCKPLSRDLRSWLTLSVVYPVFRRIDPLVDRIVGERETFLEHLAAYRRSQEYVTASVQNTLERRGELRQQKAGKERLIHREEWAEHMFKAGLRHAREHPECVKAQQEREAASNENLDRRLQTIEEQLGIR